MTHDSTTRSTFDLLLTPAVAALLFVAGYAALFIAPTERSMGVVQRIFYFHVPSAWTAFVAFFIVFIAQIAYLTRRRQHWDWLALSAPAVGLPFCTARPRTGPLWGPT